MQKKSILRLRRTKQDNVESRIKEKIKQRETSLQARKQALDASTIQERKLPLRKPINLIIAHHFNGDDYISQIQRANFQSKYNTTAEKVIYDVNLDINAITSNPLRQQIIFKGINEKPDTYTADQDLKRHKNISIHVDDLKSFVLNKVVEGIDYEASVLESIDNASFLTFCQGVLNAVVSFKEQACKQKLNADDSTNDTLANIKDIQLLKSLCKELKSHHNGIFHYMKPMKVLNFPEQYNDFNYSPNAFKKSAYRARKLVEYADICKKIILRNYQRILREVKIANQIKWEHIRLPGDFAASFIAEEDFSNSETDKKINELEGIKKQYLDKIDETIDAEVTYLTELEQKQAEQYVNFQNNLIQVTDNLQLKLAQEAGLMTRRVMYEVCQNAMKKEIQASFEHYIVQKLNEQTESYKISIHFKHIESKSHTDDKCLNPELETLIAYKVVKHFFETSDLVKSLSMNCSPEINIFCITNQSDDEGWQHEGKDYRQELQQSIEVVNFWPDAIHPYAEMLNISLIKISEL